MKKKNKYCGARLKSLRESESMTQVRLGKIIGVSGKAISRYENEKAEPTMLAIIAYSNYFNVSADYIMGRTDSKKPNEGNEILLFLQNNGLSAKMGCRILKEALKEQRFLVMAEEESCYKGE